MSPLRKAWLHTYSILPLIRQLAENVLINVFLKFPIGDLGVLDFSEQAQS